MTSAYIPVTLTQAQQDGIDLILRPALKGDPGTPGNAAQKFTFTQASPSDTWIINHNLGIKPFVALYSLGSIQIEGQVTHVSDNQTRVEFSGPVAGFAVCQ